ncbi:MAG TPA: chemotaxis protein CheW [Polyangiales bacterium]|jgi:purine-binding chemotaxis protein CheW|nr:chemotaxis protein CheW [Polyangiales bacterium]
MSQAMQKATLAPDPESETGAVAVLAVTAGDELYGFPLSSVREILIPPPLTEVPRAPAPVLGIITVRGQIITVVDLPKILNLRVEHRGPCGRVLLVDTGEELIGVAVDRVIQVYRMEPSQIEYASAMQTELSDYVLGIGRLASTQSAVDEMLILIDPLSLLGRFG